MEYPIPVLCASLKQTGYTDDFCDEWAEGLKANMVEMFNLTGEAIPSVVALIEGEDSLVQVVFDLRKVFEEEVGPLIATECVSDFMKRNQVFALLVITEAWMTYVDVDGLSEVVGVPTTVVMPASVEEEELNGSKIEVMEIRLERPESILSWTYQIVRMGDTACLGEEIEQDLTGCSVGALINFFNRPESTNPVRKLLEQDDSNDDGRWN